MSKVPSSAECRQGFSAMVYASVKTGQAWESFPSLDDQGTSCLGRESAGPQGGEP